MVEATRKSIKEKVNKTSTPPAELSLISEEANLNLSRAESIATPRAELSRVIRHEDSMNQEDMAR